MRKDPRQILGLMLELNFGYDKEGRR